MQNTHYICDICNGKYTHANRAQHFKSIKHQTSLNNNDYFLLERYSLIICDSPSFLNSDSFCHVESF